MNNLIEFEGMEVELLVIDGVEYFNPYHIGKCLEMDSSTVRNYLSEMSPKQAVLLTNSDVGLTDIRKFNNAGEKFITESGVYKICCKSRKPTAEKFVDWVCDEVLPSIRKTGMYTIHFAHDALIPEKEQFLIQMERNKEKIKFADAMSVAEGTIMIGDLAKILKSNGVDVGQNRLFAILRREGFLISRRGSLYNTPTQRAMEMKLFEVKETVWQDEDGNEFISLTTKVTGKGQIYFINRYLDCTGDGTNEN